MKIKRKTKKNLRVASILSAGAAALTASECLAVEWTPLIQASYFDGIRADMLTTVAGIVGLLLIVVGLGLLYKVFR